MENIIKERNDLLTLLLDSSDKLLVVGLAKNNVIIDKTIYSCWQRQSEYMILETDNLLKRNNIDPKLINEIVVTKGPGSYTGLRIALTIAKVYSYSLNINCFALSSLNILEEKDKKTICLMNARSSRSYVGIYENDKVILNDEVMNNDDVISLIKEHDDYLISGDISYLDLDEESLINNNRLVHLSNNNYELLLNNMIRLKNDSNKVNNILDLKAVYLKD